LFSVAFWLIALSILVWEFWPFSNKMVQSVAFSTSVKTDTAVMRKINVIEFGIDTDQQRVIQKIVAPVKTKKGLPPICSFFGQGCNESNYSPSDEERGFTEIWSSLPDESGRLMELKNCTVKSPDDWICKSNWYRSEDNEKNKNFIGKSDGEWISNPSISGKINWKSILLFEEFRCGENLCFITTKEKYAEIQKKRHDEMKRVLFGTN
jgi:hypothetical protein